MFGPKKLIQRPKLVRGISGKMRAIYLQGYDQLIFKNKQIQISFSLLLISPIRQCQIDFTR